MSGWKSVFLLAGHCLDIGLYPSDIGLEFRTRLWHYSDINSGPWASGMEFIVILVEGFWLLTSIAKCSVCGVVGFLDLFWLLLRFVIYLIKNIHSQSLFASSSQWPFVSCSSHTCIYIYVDVYMYMYICVYILLCIIFVYVLYIYIYCVLCDHLVVSIAVMYEAVAVLVVLPYFKPIGFYFVISLI